MPGPRSHGRSAMCGRGVTRPVKVICGLQGIPARLQTKDPTTTTTENVQCAELTEASCRSPVSLTLSNSILVDKVQGLTVSLIICPPLSDGLCYRARDPLPESLLAGWRGEERELAHLPPDGPVTQSVVWCPQ
ncbi:hypothetical protein J6590_036455 [Homalodisca vitripennis]|nr:hypothetical protein J6590_036455 [Homalodisca vitripennis]